MSIVFPNVAEVQGLYGPFSFSEKLLQKIWLRGDFDRSAARATDGRRVHIFHPGKWNLLGGPDFHGARFAFDDGENRTGDVELHLHASDWNAHGHARDPAYDGVQLHVVLFPPPVGAVTRGAGGREIPILALLPLLHHDLESFAADDAVESLAQRPSGRVLDELGQLSAPDLIRLLREHGEQRWRLKVHFARQRLNRLGWTAACHHAALEILGYRFDRGPMLRLAGRFPLAAWAAGAVDAGRALAAEAEAWSAQGVRPANRPRARLEQYAKWVRARPDWPDHLAQELSTWPEPDGEAGTRRIRREHRFAARRARLAAACCGEAIGGTRFDTLVCDGWLPLFAAHSGDKMNLGPIWVHWFPGDLPSWLSKSLRQLAVFTPEQPACTGLAQGLLGWDLAGEAAMVARLGRGA
jgi:hypothetical protein